MTTSTKVMIPTGANTCVRQGSVEEGPWDLGLKMTLGTTPEFRLELEQSLCESFPALVQFTNQQKDPIISQRENVWVPIPGTSVRFPNTVLPFLIKVHSVPVKPSFVSRDLFLALLNSSGREEK